ncbi:Uncharacterised protein [Enterobacter hormaechei]|nr:Uncharacterised protein [Enterobacter hormaechei]VAM09056.1 Uncharacterised protein [Enterobacter hormaechei]
MDAQGEIAVLVHAATVYPIETTNLLDSATVVIEHHSALPGVRHMLIVTVKHRKVIELILASKIEELVSQVQFG